jgi:hypothetical protein
MADDIHNECLAQHVIDAFMSEQIAHVEQIARMPLAVSTLP